MKEVSILIPARNESQKLKELVRIIIKLTNFEILIVEGGSTDDTWEVIEEIFEMYPSRVRILKQTKSGKFNAVLEAAELAEGKFLHIWDADGTVSAADNLRIIKKAVSNGQPVIGDRLHRIMEKKAMRFFNYLGNWAFALLWIPLIRTWPTDMLCGSKIFPSVVFSSMPESLAKRDPYGDFALTAHALSLGFKVESLHVNYLARKYGTTNIKRWQGGIQLLSTTLYIYKYTFSRKKNA